MSAMPQRRVDAFWAYVNFEPMSGCWLWGGTITSKGYGEFWDGKKLQLAHRVAWLLHGYEIPQGLVLDHLCRNRACVNPEHLRTATSKENTLAPGSEARAAIQARREACSKCGGPFIVRKTNGHRQCAPCAKLLVKQWRLRRKEMGHECE